MPGRLAGLASILVAIAVGCNHNARRCVPTEIQNAGPRVDLSAPSGENHPLEHSVVMDILGGNKGNTADPHEAPSGRTYQILALSGGAVYGAYTTGVLNGWTRAGDRPNFDIVTGISTGGLISTFAFLGSSYDPLLAELYTTVTSDEIYKRRPTISILWSDSAASSKPLKHLIDARIDCNVLQQVAQAHAQGRRLFIGTTDLDTRKFVVWDMGAIASSNKPDSLELYRKIVLASASVPGFFPPVAIDVCINGQKYTEWHADGGTTTQVFVPASVLNFDPEVLRSGRKPLVGSDVYVVIAGKLYADPVCTDPKLKDIAGSALTALTFAQTRADMTRIWTVCRLTGMRYHSTAIPQSTPAPLDSLSFKPAEMRIMYDAGYCQGLSRSSWRSTPPGAETNEQVVPRSGTDFLSSVVCPPASAIRRSSTQ